MIKKQRGRLITGWRQAVPTNATSSRKRSATNTGKPAAAASPATEEPPPKEQWETEGGKVVKPGT